MVPVSWQMGALSALGQGDVLGDEGEGEVGLAAGRFEGAVRLDHLAHVRRQEGGRAADQFEEVGVEAAQRSSETT